MNILQVVQKQAKKAGIRTIIIAIVVPILFVALSSWSVNIFLRTEYELIGYEDAFKASTTAKSFKEYIHSVESLVETSAEGVEYLVNMNAGYDEIHAYLTKKSRDRSNDVSDDTDGIYGFINGVYNDGYDWIPYEGYDPTERIWYKEAIEAKGKMTLVEPYIDARTDILIVTVTKALKNGRDVIAADLRLDGFQKMTEEIAEQVNEHDIMVLDKSGWVIASSLPGENGINYSEDMNSERGIVFSEWQKSNGNSFTATLQGKRYLFSQEDIGYGWTAFTITDVTVLYRTLANMAIIAVAVIIVLTILIIMLIFLVARRRIKAEDDNESLEAIAKIFMTLHKVDLVENTFKQIICHDYRVAKAIGNKTTDNQSVINEVMKEVTERRSLDDVLEFVNLSTLDERMGIKDSITTEFLNYEHLWFRGRFVVVDRQKNGKLKTVLLATEFIDDEKRFRDKMQFLAETDQLTGINNRGSGERKIRQLLGLGKGGMFILFDADKFKSINDTYGHEAGDAVLIAIADCMKHSFRERDIVLRLGGDEFAVYVPYVFDRRDGEPIIRRFIDSIEKINLPEIEDRRISISIGVSFFRDNDTYTFEDLYKQADSCAYESKKVSGCFATYYTKADGL